jgi:hypothetical protein
MVCFSASSHFSAFTRRTGWALTLLSEENLSYASTCQTIGLNTGYFASFTVFLALNSEAFRYVYAMIIPIPLLNPRVYSAKGGASQCCHSVHIFVSGVLSASPLPYGSRSSKKRCDSPRCFPIINWTHLPLHFSGRRSSSRGRTRASQVSTKLSGTS